MIKQNDEDFTMQIQVYWLIFRNIIILSLICRKQLDNMKWDWIKLESMKLLLMIYNTRSSDLRNRNTEMTCL